ncbi:SNARE-like domain protein [Selenomonas sp. oral taxon 137 str. F0430]|uniref:TVP38/TMEM64 family protein n=1 Tax=unclassified Selenomonas TaxID=2637378 RepID=UPI0001EB2238|nr:MULTISPECIES: TVP38/TMEM64 family protein [unclassified Selenomonas]EFR42007.1 SNARE-like domain protein [Selenomonas sp. oral taxon 137 str. F0430]EJP34059.1 SNARE-like domain protein [Selenomonas sp. FOBRC9]
MKQHMGMGVMKVGAAAAIVLLFGIIHLAAPGFLPELFALLSTGDISATVEYIRGYGDSAAVFAFFLTLFVNALGFPPAIIFSTANVMLFGIVPGIILSCAAETVGVTIAFLLMRFYFRDAAEKVITKSPFLSKIDRYSGTKGFFVMLIARMIPYIPSAILNAVGALSSIRLREYVIASFVGKFPSTGIEAIIGHDLIVKQPDHTRLIVVIVCAIVLIAGAWRYENHVMKAEAAHAEEDAS